MRECLAAVLRQPFDRRQRLTHGSYAVRRELRIAAAYRVRVATSHLRRCSHIDVGPLFESRTATAWWQRGEEARARARRRAEAANVRRKTRARGEFDAAREAGLKIQAREAARRRREGVDVPSLFSAAMAARRFVWAAAAGGVTVGVHQEEGSGELSSQSNFEWLEAGTSFNFSISGGPS